jgi:hypothetical protein
MRLLAKLVEEGYSSTNNQLSTFDQISITEEVFLPHSNM